MLPANKKNNNNSELQTERLQRKKKIPSKGKPCTREPLFSIGFHPPGETKGNLAGQINVTPKQPTEPVFFTELPVSLCSLGPELWSRA